MIIPVDRIRTELTTLLQELGVKKLPEPVLNADPKDALHIIFDCVEDNFDSHYWEPAKQALRKDIQENGLPHYYRIDVLPFMCDGSQPALYVGVQPSDVPGAGRLKMKLENIDW